MKLRTFVVTGGIVAALGLQGCIGAINQACLETAAARGTAQALVNDAQTSLAQAALVVPKIANQGIRERAEVSLYAAQQALRGVEAALRGVERGCENPDIKAVFHDFVEAWKVLSPFLSLLAGPGGESSVPEPLVVSSP